MTRVFKATLASQAGARGRRATEASSGGFTLIELMVTVAIVAILVSIAYPAYQDSVRKSRRAQVKADLAELAQGYERFHTVNNTYVGYWSTVPASRRVSPNTAGATVAYALSEEEDANTFTLTATPQGAQSSDTRCGVLSLNQAGVKTEAGSGTVSDCW